MTFGTDTATLAVFDPDVLMARIGDDCDWWCDDFASLEEVQRGDIALIGLGGDGVFKVRVTDGDLTEAERAYASERLTVGVVISSGRLFAGPGEHLPGGHKAPRSTQPECKGFFASVAPGAYSIEVYGIAWTDAPDWYTPPGEATPPSAPADVVLRLIPHRLEFRGPSEEPRLFVSSGGWVFPEAPRRLGPVPGLCLTTLVVRRRDDLVLKPCGPLGYRPVLPDMSGLDWNDEVEVRVLSVDHGKQEFAAELVGKRGRRP